MKSLVSLFAFLTWALTVGATNYILSPLVPPDTGSRGPFLILSNDAPSVRYQQVYGSTDFQASGVPAWRITDIIFSTGGGPLDVNLVNVQINLSTTQKRPDGLSTIFSENVGSDDTVVFSGSLHLLNGQGDSYGTFISLQRSFDYDWHAGNLLLEVRNFQTIAPQQLFLFN